jgi:hypothetical protein
MSFALNIRVREIGLTMNHSMFARFLRNLVVYVLVSFVVMAAPSYGFQRNVSDRFSRQKAAKVVGILNALHQLSRIASMQRDVDLSRTTRKKVYGQVARFKHPDDLRTLALMCRYLTMITDVDYVAYDRVFEVALWRCVDLLAEDPSDAAVESLQSLWDLSNTDAGATRLFEEATSRQKAKRQRAPTK